MTPEQIALVQKAVSEMRTISVQSEQPHSSDSLSDLLTKNGILSASISLSDLTATGFSRAGLVALDALAKLYRPQGGANNRLASNSTVAKMLSGQMISLWKGKSPDSLASADYAELENSVDRWFQSLTQVRQHVVPCTLTPYPIPSFSIGPVTFYHLSEFPSEEFGVVREQIAESFQLGDLIRLAKERYAPWMAKVRITGRADNESISSADIATDIALAILQLSLPNFDLRGIARATARAAPVWRVEIWKGADGTLRQSSSNREPARVVAPDAFVYGLTQIRPLIDSMERRLSSYLEATSTLPELDEAWCNAAYWYHEALAETLETVAIAKLETAIEVLFRSESMSGSKRRLLDSFDAIFGLKENDPIAPGSTVTAGQLTTAITTARSRVLHGTWPTLHTDLPSAKGHAPATYADVELLARILLVQFSIYIDAYLQAGNAIDGTNDLIAWIKVQRTHTSSQSPQATS
jgi:hypothetical protein